MHVCDHENLDIFQRLNGVDCNLLSSYLTIKSKLHYAVTSQYILSPIHFFFSFNPKMLFGTLVAVFNKHFVEEEKIQSIKSHLRGI